MRIRFIAGLVAWVVIAAMPAAHAHESRPAYLEINETSPGRYDVLWRTPVLSGMRLPVMLAMPGDAQNVVGKNEADGDNHFRTAGRQHAQRGSAIRTIARLDFRDVDAQLLLRQMQATIGAVVERFVAQPAYIEHQAHSKCAGWARFVLRQLGKQRSKE